MHETIFVLGLGETLKFFNDFKAPTIGVNDIWSKVKTQIVVCVDQPSKFVPDRLNTIKNCKPKIFFSQLKEWGKYITEPYYWNVPIVAVDHRKTPFRENVIYHSNNSPFVACSLASTLNYKNIVIYGVDFNNHPKLKGSFALTRIVKDFDWLKGNLEKRGIELFVGHRASKLSEVMPVWERSMVAS